MSLWKLRLSMVAAVALLIGLTTLFITAILMAIGITDIFTILFIVIIISLFQWLFSPYLVDKVYKVREADPNRYSKLYKIIDKLSIKSGLKKPKVMIADMNIPNAFAYGSPLTGNRVAVTKGLMNILDDDEVEAVLGHEFGHLTHKDMQIMMFISILPAIFYYIGYSLYFSGIFGADRDEGASYAFIIGMLSLLIYYILSLVVLWFSRLREYYADSHSMKIVEDGGPKLARALAKIVEYTGAMKNKGVNTSSYSSLKALFIADPDKAVEEFNELREKGIVTSDIVYKLAHRKVTFGDRIIELLSTHPNTTKRIRRLLGGRLP